MFKSLFPINDFLSACSDMLIIPVATSCRHNSCGGPMNLLSTSFLWQICNFYCLINWTRSFGVGHLYIKNAIRQLWSWSQCMHPVAVYSCSQKEHMRPQASFSTMQCTGSSKYYSIIMWWHVVGNTIKFNTLNNAKRFESLAIFLDVCMICTYKATRQEKGKKNLIMIVSKICIGSWSMGPNSWTSAYIDNGKPVRYEQWQLLLLTPQFAADVVGMIISFGRATVPSSNACAALFL